MSQYKHIDYKKLKTLIESSHTFDRVYYLREFQDARLADMTPIEHYCKVGINEDRSPNGIFDPVWYRETYQDVKEDGSYPLVHFVRFGIRENRFMNAVEKSEYERMVDSGFDIEFYKNHYSDLKIQDETFDFILHFIRYGKREGREYRFLHAGDENYTTLSKSLYTSVQEAFDTAFYLQTYPDIKAAGVNPFDHYMNYGWKEGRLPNDWFDPVYYCEKYPDAKVSDKEPLSHFIEIGQYESRITRQIKIPNYNGPLKNDIPKIVFESLEEGYTKYQEHNGMEPDIKTIAFYLPQFHPFPENDAWWGKGFTEWTNVTKAQPNFTNHYQPHLPIHFGFYDLRVPEILIEQAELARNYGIYGFNFYYYWFDGKVLMHKPFEILLKHKEIDINFCITWANENWSRRWDGAEHDILIGQNHCEKDSIAFLENLYPFFKDERYIRIDNKPVLIIYRADIIPQMKETVELWRNKAVQDGFDGLYLICSQTFGITSPEPFGFDAAMEFPPHTVMSRRIDEEVEMVNHEFTGSIYDYEEVVQNACQKEEPNYKMFRTAMLSWDNTARKQNNSHSFHHFSLLKYKQWISNIAFNTYNNPKYEKNEKLIFINAWNEWAEGTHLEPDRKFGYGYLEATHQVIKNFDPQYADILHKSSVKRNDIAVILHIHYTDIWDDIAHYLSNLKTFGFDLYITLTNIEYGVVDKILLDYPEANIRLVENRGRDVLPLIETLKNISELNYDYVCKIHSKKSAYRDDGSAIRNELYDSMLGNRAVIQKILDYFNTNQEAGILVNQKYLLKHTDHNMTFDQEIVDQLASVFGFSFEKSVFPAGSMFWFRPKALQGLEKLENTMFLPEEGLADGTIAHGLERLFGSIANQNNYQIVGI